jgi:hypothetical protein
MAPSSARDWSVGRIDDKPMLAQNCFLSRNWRTALPISASAEQNSFVEKHRTCFSA